MMRFTMATMDSYDGASCGYEGPKLIKQGGIKRWLKSPFRDKGFDVSIMIAKVVEYATDIFPYWTQEMADSLPIEDGGQLEVMKVKVFGRPFGDMSYHLTGNPSTSEQIVLGFLDFVEPPKCTRDKFQCISDAEWASFLEQLIAHFEIDPDDVIKVDQTIFNSHKWVVDKCSLKNCARPLFDRW